MSGRLDNRRNSERLDIMETYVSRWGCNARLEDGNWCPNPRSRTEGGPFSERRLCNDHLRLYRVHDRIIGRILTIPPK